MPRRQSLSSTDGAVAIAASSFNGSLTISDSQSCTQNSNRTNGSLSVANCQ
jgi:hypothetical protein